MREQREQDKNSKKGKLRLKLILFGFLALIVAYFVGYYIFEYYRLGKYDIKLFEDWRSYTAFLMSKVPYVNKYVKYQPMKVLSVEDYYNEQLKIYLERLEKQSEELKSKAEELATLKKNIEEEQKKLEELRKEVEKEKAELEKEKAEWEDYKNRLKTLANWLASSNPAQIAPAISSDQVSVDLLVDSLRMLSDDVAAEILQALSNVNPQKAASVLSRLGTKEADQ
ncbi:MAG: hypothetical protein PWQ20_931 [Thermotogaceae bacterium]|jgi:flagellar motility protein MotE (MotC chaperone)|nr:hypothetical protein [Thermotogaceae bacterium]MDN5337861.1 hypothetical protein [Thermotogaceae bacterium]